MGVKKVDELNTSLLEAWSIPWLSWIVTYSVVCSDFLNDLFRISFVYSSVISSLLYPSASSSLMNWKYEGDHLTNQVIDASRGMMKKMVTLQNRLSRLPRSNFKTQRNTFKWSDLSMALVVSLLKWWDQFAFEADNANPDMRAIPQLSLGHRFHLRASSGKIGIFIVLKR